VIFAPQALGVKEDKLIIRSNDPDESIVEVRLYGEGTDPNIMVVPSYIDLGQVKIGEVSNISEIAITNSGVGSLRIEGIGLSAGTTNEFELVNLPNSYPVELKGGGADILKIGVRYRPSGEGKDSGAVEIKSSDNDNKVVYVNLSGEGIKCTPSCVNKECGDDGCGGSCGSCGANAICSNYTCVCTSGYGNCDGLWSNGCEKNLTNDVNNCGGCGNVCNLPNTAVNSCVNGSCKVVSCVNGYGNCDGVNDNGCETNLTSINSCGTSCSNKVVCSTNNGSNPVCDSGVCKLSCNIGYSDCNARVGSSDGCENQDDPKHIWSKRFGGSGDDFGRSVSVDSLGNVYITGYFSSSTIDFGGGALTNAGGDDIFLAKFDSNGNHLWSKRFGGSSSDYGSSVSVDSSGNVYITGYFNSSTIDFGGGVLTNAGGSDIFLAKFDSNGNHLWSKRFGEDYSDIGSSVSVDSSGNVYITGYFNSSTIDFGGGVLTNNGNTDIFLAKFDSNGNHIWSKRFGRGGVDRGYSVSVDSSGNVYGTGYYNSSYIDFGGCPLSSVGSHDIFLIKYAP